MTGADIRRIYGGPHASSNGLPGLDIHSRKCDGPGCNETFLSTVAFAKPAYHSEGCKVRAAAERAKARKERLS